MNTTTTMTNPIIECPCCGRAVRVVRGHIARHGHQGGRGSGPTCPGAGWQPELALQGVIDECTATHAELLAEAEAEPEFARYRLREAAEVARVISRLRSRQDRTGDA